MNRLAKFLNGITSMRLPKAGQPEYKLADRFINRQSVYKLVRFTISSQHRHFDVCMYVSRWSMVHSALWIVSDLRYKCINLRVGVFNACAYHSPGGRTKGSCAHGIINVP